MTPTEAILKLKAHGMTEAAIAAAASTTQPTINRIKKGKDPFYALGRKLVAMALVLPDKPPEQKK